MTVTFVIEGARIGRLEDFWPVVGEAINGPCGYFGSSLDGFAACLRGGLGQPVDHDYIIEWRDHRLSQSRLGFPETVRQLEFRLQRCHADDRTQIRVNLDLDEARACRGPTAFDWVIAIMEREIPGRYRLR